MMNILNTQILVGMINNIRINQKENIHVIKKYYNDNYLYYLLDLPIVLINLIIEYVDDIFDVTLSIRKDDIKSYNTDQKKDVHYININANNIVINCDTYNFNLLLLIEITNDFSFIIFDDLWNFQLGDDIAKLYYGESEFNTSNFTWCAEKYCSILFDKYMNNNNITKHLSKKIKDITYNNDISKISIFKAYDESSSEMFCSKLSDNIFQCYKNSNYPQFEKYNAITMHINNHNKLQNVINIIELMIRHISLILRRSYVSTTNKYYIGHMDQTSEDSMSISKN
jgi:hypothetical protein